eukprot:6563991-Heterocapsa_arctica.AAC.1
MAMFFIICYPLSESLARRLRSAHLESLSLPAGKCSGVISRASPGESGRLSTGSASFVFASASF